MNTMMCFALMVIVMTISASALPRAEAHEQDKRLQDLTQWPMECEGAAMRLDFAVIDTKKIDGGYLIIVARLGDGEVSNRLNQTRLAGIQEYILRRGSDFEIRSSARSQSQRAWSCRSLRWRT